MSSYSSDDINRLVASIEDLARTMSRGGSNNSRSNNSNRGSTRGAPNNRNNNSNNSSEQKRKRDANKRDYDAKQNNIKNMNELNRQANRLSSTLLASDSGFKEMNWHVSQVVSHTKMFVKGLSSLSMFAIATVSSLSYLAVTMRDNALVYRDLSNIGQTFGGSMLGMSKAAASAHLPLEDFAKLLRQNATAAAVLGSKGIGDLTKSFRAGLFEFDMLNMSTSDLNEFMSGYLTLQQRQGLLSRIGNQQASQSIANLTMETTKLANLTGKNRLDILKQSREAMEHHSFSSRMQMASGEGAEKFTESAMKAVNYMAAMPGEAGSLLSNAMAQTVGMGVAEITEFAQIAGAAGMGNLTGMFNQINKKIYDGTVTDKDMEDMRSNMLGALEANFDSLSRSANMGHEQSIQMVRLHNELMNFKKKELKDLEDQNAMTSFAMRFEQMVKAFSGDARTGLYTLFEEISNRMGDGGFFQTLVRLQDALLRFSSRIQGFVETVMTPERIQSFERFLIGTIDMFGNLLTGLGTVIDKFGLVKTAIGAFIAAMVVKKGIGKVRETLGRTYSIGQGNNFRFVPGSGALLVQTIGGNLGGGGGRGSPKGGRRNWGRAAKFGAGALLTGLASNALSKTDDFTGKGTIESGLNIASMASTGAMIGSIIPGIGTVVGGIAGGLVGVGMELFENFDSVSDAIGGITAGAGELFSGLVSGTASLVSAAYDGVTSAIDGTLSGAASLVSGIYGSISNTVSNITEGALGFASNIASTYYETLSSIGTAAKDLAVGVASSAYDVLSDTASNIWDMQKQAVGLVWSGITGAGNFISDTVSSGISTVGDIAGSVADYTADIFPSMSDWINKLNIGSTNSPVAIPPQPIVAPNVPLTIDQQQVVDQIIALQDTIRQQTAIDIATKQLMENLIDITNNSNDTTRAGLIEMIETLKEANKELKIIAENAGL